MWHTSHRPLDEVSWDADRIGVTHSGTKKAALERNFGKEMTFTNPGGGKHMFSLRVDGSQMHNTPDDPVSDGMGNSIHQRFASGSEIIPERSRLDEFVRETDMGPNDQKYAEDIIADWTDIPADPAAGRPLGHVQPSKGVFYTNEAEDAGSVSAAAPASAYTPLAEFEVRHATFDVEHPDKLATIGPQQEHSKSYPTQFRNEQFRLFDVTPHDEGEELPRREYRHGGPELRRVR